MPSLKCALMKGDAAVRISLWTWILSVFLVDSSSPWTTSVKSHKEPFLRELGKRIDHFFFPFTKELISYSQFDQQLLKKVMGKMVLTSPEISFLFISFLFVSWVIVDSFPLSTETTYQWRLSKIDCIKSGHDRSGFIAFVNQRWIKKNELEIDGYN